ncbi:uncharacterized protein LOC123675541 [Harmonia axyridis]|uniref:uncharacterized protein LOC123675541 n=1 Tax=Harmonia axyridis TaxID=115357 RepID=UPI001E27658D|nr:uncharacterized protein LOC123675541 [Harmonia axyridis]
MNSKFVMIFILSAICVLSVKSEEGKMCPFLAACLKETDGKVKPEDLKALKDATLENLDDISEDVLCVSKCALEKRKVLVDDKIDVDKMMTDKMLMENILKKEDFSECLKKIDAIKQCGDIKEFMKCKILFTKD